MSSKVEKLEKNKVKVEITVPVSEFEVAIDKAFRQNASKIIEDIKICVTRLFYHSLYGNIKKKLFCQGIVLLKI